MLCPICKCDTFTAVTEKEGLILTCRNQKCPNCGRAIVNLEGGESND